LRGYVKKSKLALWTTVPSARKRLEAAAATRQSLKAALLQKKRCEAILEASQRRKSRPSAFPKHWQNGDGYAQPKPRKRIAPVSKKRAAERKTYLSLRDEFLMLNCRCERCGKAATEVHHKQGRGRHYLEVTTWAALCSCCHSWIHENVAEAKAAGWLIGGGDWG